MRSGGCSDAYNIELGIEGQLYQSETAGKYRKVCSSLADDLPIYKHESADLYIYHVLVPPSTLSVWFVSSTIAGSDFKLFGIHTASKSENCPDTTFTIFWFVKTGPGGSDLARDSQIKVTPTTRHGLSYGHGGLLG